MIQIKYAVEQELYLLSPLKSLKTEVFGEKTSEEKIGTCLGVCTFQQWSQNTHKIVVSILILYCSLCHQSNAVFSSNQQISQHTLQGNTGY